jgi:hypothetical protein
MWLLILRWLLARWVYVLAVGAFAAYTGYIWNKGDNHGEAKVEKQIATETKRIQDAWSKIDRSPSDVGIALRRLRQRSHED